MRKLNINTGPPIKRFIDGVIWWKEEGHLSTWNKMRKAVNRHKRQYRRFQREQRVKKHQEWLLWSHWQDEDPQPLKHSKWFG